MKTHIVYADDSEDDLENLAPTVDPEAREITMIDEFCGVASVLQFREVKRIVFEPGE